MSHVCYASENDLVHLLLRSHAGVAEAVELGGAARRSLDHAHGGVAIRRGRSHLVVEKLRLKFVLASVLAGLIVSASSAMAVSVVPTRVTYLNANFGPYDVSGFNFYRSKNTIDFDSATASADASRSGSAVRFSISSNGDPYETSAGFSQYDIGMVRAGSASLTNITVTASSLSLSGDAHFALNLWFDKDNNGEYFVWNNNRLAGV